MDYLLLSRYAAVQVLDTFWANERSEMLQEGAAGKLSLSCAMPLDFVISDKLAITIISCSAALAVSTLGLLLSLGAVLLF